MIKNIDFYYINFKLLKMT